MNIIRRLFISAILLTFTSTSFAKLQLGAPFNDNVILQRDVEHPVWGWATAGDTVSVKFGGQTKESTVGNDGKWSLFLDPIPASFEPRELTISTKKGESKVLKNVLVGEVWLASGQSNMQWIVSKSNASLLKVEPVYGINPIRECTVTDYYSALHPLEHVAAEWNDGNYGQFSAIAFAFAENLYRELNVPIGILNCSFSQTSIQAWTPRIGFSVGSDPVSKALYQSILETDPKSPEHKKAWSEFYGALEADLSEGGKGVQDIIQKKPGNLGDNRGPSWLYNARLHPMVPFPVRGAIWNQGYANIQGGMLYRQGLHNLIGGWRAVWERPDLPVYFHQFYSPNVKGGRKFSYPEVQRAAGMRTGTLLAREIPNTGMASQIDITGGVHYKTKTVPGQRLALHALKNQYGKDIVTDGPIFNSYKVDGAKVTISFDHAEGGLVVAETATNAGGKKTGGNGFANPKLVPDGISKIEHFYIADENRIWHLAKAEIAGDKIVLQAPGVSTPKGVTYGTAGIGGTPGLYNKALLPMSPFILYENEIVTGENWPLPTLEVHGAKKRSTTKGIVYEHRKLPILSTQFRDNAVFQADAPVTIFGSTVNLWRDRVEGETIINFSFGDITQTIPVDAKMKEWRVTLPAMPVSDKKYKLEVTLTIDGKVIHKRTAENIVFGDVFYIGAADIDWVIPDFEKSDQTVRMITRKAKRASFVRPSRYSVAVSTAPKNRFASLWEDADGAAAYIGHMIARKTNRPVGVIFMQSLKWKKDPDSLLKQWISPDFLKEVKALNEDYKQIASVRPGNEIYNENVNRYISAWKAYWSDYIPKMISTGKVPDEIPWGTFPELSNKITTNASETNNILVNSFTPATLSGVIFLSNPDMFAEETDLHFSEEMSALINGLRHEFGNKSLPFVYTEPVKSLVTIPVKPQKEISGVTIIPVSDWKSAEPLAAATEALLAKIGK